MGSIFKPSTTVVQSPQQSTTTYDIPAYFKEIQERTLRKGETEFSQPYQGYTGQRIAQMDPLETQAAGIYQNQILPQAGQLAGIGAQTYDKATAASYANPYQDQVISGALGDLGEAYSQSQKGMSAQAIGAGAFGGSRQAIENVLGQERYLDTVGDTSARLRQAGFESGANRFMQDRSAQLQSAQSQIGALGQTALGIASYGTQARGIEQAGLAETYRDFIEEREYGGNQVKQMIGALSGAPIRSYGEERSGSVGTPGVGASPFGQIVGAGLAAYQAGLFSDIRLKEDIKLVGKSASGINIYNFKYKGDDKTYQGVMAHQVPHASHITDSGYLVVDYSQLDVEFKEIH